MTLPVFRTRGQMRAQIAAWQHAGETVGLVPTMGALHAGHLALVTDVKQRCPRAVASIFVNPTQFGPNEDYSRYPRDEAGDAALLHSVGCDALFAPTVEEMYPSAEATRVSVAGNITTGLCDSARPGHFVGVATIVAKLLIGLLPDRAIFGQKDWQQLQVIRRLTADLSIPVDIDSLPTQREPDGLALSSRNRYLTPQERQIAPMLNVTLQELARLAASGADITVPLQGAREKLVQAGFGNVDYLEMRAAETLAPLSRATEPARLFVAAHLGKARLIDNVAVEA